jgi:hypothetical protein
MPESVTYVPGMDCFLCARMGIQHFFPPTLRLGHRFLRRWVTDWVTPEGTTLSFPDAIPFSRYGYMTAAAAHTSYPGYQPCSVLRSDARGEPSLRTRESRNRRSARPCSQYESTRLTDRRDVSASARRSLP